MSFSWNIGAGADPNISRIYSFAEQVKIHRAAPHDSYMRILGQFRQFSYKLFFLLVYEEIEIILLQ